MFIQEGVRQLLAASLAGLKLLLQLAALLLQLEGLTSVSSRPIVRRMSDEVMSTAVRGLEVTIGFDESFFEGTSVFVLGAVLERFLRKYATINSFTETVLKTQKRGEIARWRPEKGLGRMI